MIKKCVSCFKKFKPEEISMELSCRATHDVIYDVAIFFYKEEHDKTENCFVCTNYWCKAAGVLLCEVDGCFAIQFESRNAFPSALP